MVTRTVRHRGARSNITFIGFYWVPVSVALVTLFLLLAAGPMPVSADSLGILLRELSGLVVALIAVAALFMFGYCLEAKSVIFIGRHCNPRTWSRKESPGRYWSVVIFYGLAFLLFAAGTCMALWRLLPPVHN